MASSENPWERGRLARIFLKNAGKMPAHPTKNEVFGGCLMVFIQKQPLTTEDICKSPRGGLLPASEN